ncbi:MAG: hypothetical protein HKN63_11090 [Rhodobacteraceae bacterium]|nr:hypothetical protein [Paracoccaceae bacterium]
MGADANLPEAAAAPWQAVDEDGRPETLPSGRRWITKGHAPTSHEFKRRE